MAGRRHHYIPRFLQKGFCIERGASVSQAVCLFRRQQAPVPANINKTFVEKDLYGSPKNTDLDELITASESSLSLFADSIREYAATTDLGISKGAAHLVWQMALRTNWLRLQQSLIGKVLLAKFVKELRENDGFAAMMKHAMPSRMAELLADVESEMEKGANGILTSEERDLFARLKSEMQSKPAQFSEFVRGLDFDFSTADVVELMNEVVPRAHNHLLKEVLGSQDHGLRTFLEGLSWRVITDVTARLILGDCGPVMIGDGGRPLGPIGACPFDECRAMVLPVSPSQHLMGATPAFFSGPTPFDLNRCVAAWSQAFIANTEELADPRLQEITGTAADAYVVKAVIQGLAELGIPVDFPLEG